MTNPTAQLTHYDAARHALQAAASVDEVKDLRDRAMALEIYAVQAKDTAMLKWATEIKIRAERRAGEMLAEMEIKPGARPLSELVPMGNQLRPPKLADLGISKKQSANWQKIAAMPDKSFEDAVTAANKSISTRSIIKIINQAKPASTPAAKSNIARRIVPQAPESPPDLADELAEARKTIAELSDEIESMAVSALPENELTAKIRRLEAELIVTRKQRDSYMKECGELKRQNASLQRQIKKLSA